MSILENESTCNGAPWARVMQKIVADKDEVASQEVTPTFDGDKETTVKVVYTANKQKALVNYVDQDKNNALIEDSGELSGLSKDLIGYSTEDTIKKLVDAGYVFVSSDYPTDAAYDIGGLPPGIADFVYSYYYNGIM